MAGLNTELQQGVFDAPEIVHTDDPRALVVAKFRELADRLESGELRGASVSWRDTGPDDPTDKADMYVNLASEMTQTASRQATQFEPRPASILKVVR